MICVILSKKNFQKNLPASYKFQYSCNLFLIDRHNFILFSKIVKYFIIIFCSSNIHKINLMNIILRYIWLKT